jgi:hypothetical protein
MASAFSVSESILPQACFFDQIEANSSKHVASRMSSDTQQLLVLRAQGVDLENLTSLNASEDYVVVEVPDVRKL